MLHVALCVMCYRVARDRQTYATDKYVTKTMHKPLVSDSVSEHDQTCDCVSPMSMHDLKRHLSSPMSMHGNQTT